jgi:hypothetical protein
MSLHAEVSLIAFLLGLVHLAVTLATLVLGRARGSLLGKVRISGEILLG